jgi:hypothetical protein
MSTEFWNQFNESMSWIWKAVVFFAAVQVLAGCGEGPDTFESQTSSEREIQAASKVGGSGFEPPSAMVEDFTEACYENSLSNVDAAFQQCLDVNQASGFDPVAHCEANRTINTNKV